VRTRVVPERCEYSLALMEAMAGAATEVDVVEFRPCVRRSNTSSPYGHNECQGRGEAGAIVRDPSLMFHARNL